MWLTVLLGLFIVPIAIAALLHGQGLTTAANVLTSVGVVSGYLWLVCGVFGFSQPRWIVWSLLYLGTALVGGVLYWSFKAIAAPDAAVWMLAAAGVARAVMVYRSYATRLAWRPVVMALTIGLDLLALDFRLLTDRFAVAAIALTGLYVMIVTFLAGLWLIRRVLAGGWPVTAVARTLIDEALRMKIVLVLIVLVMLTVPVLPYVGDTDELLKYRIATFLAWSLWATALLICLMTVFLSCWTICGEVRHRQIHLTLTKPIGRAQYLLGKWLGINLVNILLLAIAGVGIYTFARLMERLPAQDAYDRASITEQVLVARVSKIPVMAGAQTLDELVAQRMERLQGNGLTDVSAASRLDHLNVVVNQWHTIEPFGSQTYVFTGLEGARDKVETVQLKLKPTANNRPDSGMLQFAMRVNGRPYGIPPMVVSEVQVIPIPTVLIDDAGRLEVVIINQNPADKALTHRTDISFTPDEGLQLLYRYGGFGPNLARGMVMIWVQTSFIAMVGLSAGTFLGFPVACLGAMLVFLTSLLSGYLAESVSAYAGLGIKDAGLWEQIMSYPGAFWTKLTGGAIWEAAKVIIRLVGELFIACVPSFSHYNPTPLIADGQAVGYGLMVRFVLIVGVVWTGVTAFVAMLIFRTRELARVTV
ncbi:MAG: hypothetical protein CMJ18_06425 [Phycisphaeraceae bacterium]|nr:hypothetical protein [Phycisphaeraceae bacterium]